MHVPRQADGEWVRIGRLVDSTESGEQKATCEQQIEKCKIWAHYALDRSTSTNLDEELIGKEIEQTLPDVRNFVIAVPGL